MNSNTIDFFNIKTMKKLFQSIITFYLKHRDQFKALANQRKYFINYPCAKNEEKIILIKKYF